jgi:ribonuclease BN (tRNA processing enzyme)
MELARDSDLVVIETTFPEGGFGADGVHLTLAQAVELSKVAKDFMLVHFTAGSYSLAKKNGLI